MPNENTRRFVVEAKNEDQTWRSAEQYKHGHLVRVSVQHATGEFTRDSVDEAQVTSEKNGFEPQVVRLSVKRVSPVANEDVDQQRVISDDWVGAQRGAGPRMGVWVHSQTEVEANGVFTMLQDAVKQAMSVDNAKAMAVVKQGPQDLLGRVMNHPWVVGIVAGLIATVAGGLLILRLV